MISPFDSLRLRLFSGRYFFFQFSPILLRFRFLRCFTLFPRYVIFAAAALLRRCFRYAIADAAFADFLLLLHGHTADFAAVSAHFFSPIAYAAFFLDGLSR